MLLISTGEIFLKGKNKPVFIQALLRNIHAALETKNATFVHNKVLCLDETHSERLQRVFGITSYTHARTASFSDLPKEALALIGTAHTFRISAARRVKVGKTSQELNEEIGAFICTQRPDLKVQLKNPDIDISIDIFADTAYLSTKTIKGLGGLPVGVSGTVFVAVTNVQRATVAGFLMLKRGCTVIASLDLPLLHKFMHGISLHVRAQQPNDILVRDVLFEDLDFAEQKTERFILTPLIGMHTEEIETLYEKIHTL